MYSKFICIWLHEKVPFKYQTEKLAGRLRKTGTDVILDPL